MRIGMLVDTYKPYLSGVTNHVDLNKRAFEDEGHEVYVFTFGNLDYQDDELHIFRSPGLSLADTGFYLSLRYKTEHKKLLQTMDVVHVHHPFLSGQLALSSCRRSQIPIVFTSQTRYDLYAQARLPFIPTAVSHSLLYTYMTYFCAAVDLVISPSHGMEKVLRRYGVKGHIEVVPHAVDWRRFHQAQPFARASLGFIEQDILLVFVGRIAPEKNVGFLLRSFAGVSQVFPNVRLMIIGSGQKAYVEEIMHLLYELGIGNRVRFVGMIPYDRLPSYLAMCDVFVTASVTEVHPLSVIEGMAAGLPVIGIDSPGVGDSVSDYETGLLATNDIASFTDKLIYLCMNKELRKKMGYQAYQASMQYDIERTSKILLGHYTHLTK
jgi:glycosyltransferase involved in cell wall biosynthesis